MRHGPMLSARWLQEAMNPTEHDPVVHAAGDCEFEGNTHGLRALEKNDERRNEFRVRARHLRQIDRNAPTPRIQRSFGAETEFLEHTCVAQVARRIDYPRVYSVLPSSSASPLVLPGA
jgi:hypothetical protein